MPRTHFVEILNCFGQKAIYQFCGFFQSSLLCSTKVVTFFVCVVWQQLLEGLIECLHGDSHVFGPLVYDPCWVQNPVLHNLFHSQFCIYNSSFVCFYNTFFELNWGILSPFFIAHALRYQDFDSSLGYPGEGPDTEYWTCRSANVDSLNSHPCALQWETSLSLFQETRLTEVNFGTINAGAKQHGKSLFPGVLLKTRADKNGHFRTPHGGVCIAASDSLCVPVLEAEDATGHLAELLVTTRFCAAWCQVDTRTKVLCMNLYGHTSSEDSHEINNHLLEKIFAFASQFGNIPILLAADFQNDPDAYPAVNSAKQFGKWVDPLVTLNEDGIPTRPLTFSQDSNFVNPSGHCSSIDGILLNECAADALVNMTVSYDDARNHAPIVATFKWKTIYQSGYVFQKPAAFDLGSLPIKNSDFDHEKIQELASSFLDCNPVDFQLDDEKCWSQINSTAINILQHLGAKFSVGPKTRASTPVFKQRTVCPGQDRSGCALTAPALKLGKAHRLLQELRCRLRRTPTKYDDFVNTYNLQDKVRKSLHQFPRFKKWNHEEFCHDQTLLNIQKEIQKMIVVERDKSKKQRIASWREKMKLGTANKQVAGFVYKWIQNKTNMVTPNLVRSPAGDIIYDPQQAIAEINEQWDQVFAANIFHQSPERVLQHAWPFIERIRCPVELPSLTGCMLKKQIMKRKVSAAAGLDGWRTVESQALPSCFYDLIATYFRDVENGTRKLPVILTTAKQSILDKCGDDSPMQKRLLSILPVFILSYTSLRFAQLKEWQAQVMPAQLHGAIKGRNLSNVHSRIRLEIDSAKSSEQAIVGLKLDKAKCFDRVVPLIACALMLGLGIPLSLIRFFAAMYSQLRRHLFYKSWASPLHTTCPNGIIQGCSLSLIAINCHMAVWAKMMETMKVPCAAFVDDSYLWDSAGQVERLQTAVYATQLWDELVGQKSNDHKSHVWASHPKARSLAYAAFPNMKKGHVVEILGARLQVSEKKSYEWPAHKTKKILREIQLIRAIPCQRSIHEHIISTKIIPQLSFAPHLNAIPKNVLKDVQSAIADLLWKNRPQCRSRHLVFAVHSKPHRTDPFLARAYCAILDTITFLKSGDGCVRDLWQQQYYANTQSVNSLLSSFQQALLILQIEHVEPFHLCFFGSIYLPVLDLAKRDLKKLLQAICRQHCYKQACQANRKDIVSSMGFFDFSMTQVCRDALKGTQVNGIPLSSAWDSACVGCNHTNDRRFKAGYCNTNLCRFCNSDVESMQHLTECTAVPNFADKPELPEQCGPNFRMLGLVEIDNTTLLERMQISQTSDIQVSQWECAMVEYIDYWSDGSCMHAAHFLHTRGSFAVVSLGGERIMSGRVFHIALNAYVCELWGLVNAFCRSKQPVCVHLDCSAVVEQAQFLIDHGFVPTSWSMFSWWSFLLQIIDYRKGFCDVPLKVQWCKAHVLDELPMYMITEQLAQQHGTNLRDLFHNRQADFHAGNVLKQDSPSLEQKITSISKWQVWLAHLHCFLDSEPDRPSRRAQQADVEERIARVTFPQPHELTLAHSVSAFAHVLPRWVWEPQLERFQWHALFDTALHHHSRATISDDDWYVSLNFFKAVVWEVTESAKTAFIELAYEFNAQNLRFSQVSHTPAAVATCLRKTHSLFMKKHGHGQHPITPGVVKATCKSEGRTLPSGTIHGCRALISSLALKQLAIDSHNRSHALHNWKHNFV